MSNQGYYQQQGGYQQGNPQYPEPSYGGGYQQPGYGQQQPPYGYASSGQMHYTQGPPPQQVIIREKKDRGCLGACLATLCCCFVVEEGCECCGECCECAADCC